MARNAIPAKQACHVQIRGVHISANSDTDSDRLFAKASSQIYFENFCQLFSDLDIL